MVKLVTQTDRDKTSALDVIDDLRKRVERGELRLLVVGFSTAAGETFTSAAGSTTFAEQIGLIELVKHDLLAKAEGRA